MCVKVLVQGYVYKVLNIKNWGMPEKWRYRYDTIFDIVSYKTLTGSCVNSFIF